MMGIEGRERELCSGSIKVRRTIEFPNSFSVGKVRVIALGRIIFTAIMNSYFSFLSNKRKKNGLLRIKVIFGLRT